MRQHLKVGVLKIRYSFCKIGCYEDILIMDIQSGQSQYALGISFVGQQPVTEKIVNVMWAWFYCLLYVEWDI